MKEKDYKVTVQYKKASELSKGHDNEDLVGTIFVIWFVASFIMMIASAAMENLYLFLMVFGQFFLVFGIILLKKSDNKNILSYIPLTVGTIIVLFSLSMLIFPKKDWGIIAASMGMLLFIFVGFGLMIIPLYKYNKNRKRCNVNIKAQVIKSESEYYASKTNDNTNRIRKLYKLTYKFIYNDKEYIVLPNSSYDSIRTKKLGDTVDIYINPDNPEDFIDFIDRISKNILVTMGFILFVSGIIALIYL